MELTISQSHIQSAILRYPVSEVNSIIASILILQGIVIMLWQLIKGSGYPYCQGYGGMWLQPRAQVGQLDKIDCAGSIDMKRIRATACILNWKSIIFLVDIIMDIACFEATMCEEKGGEPLSQQRKIVFTAGKYLQHLRI